MVWLGRGMRVDEEQNENGGDASSQRAPLSPLHCLLDCRKRFSAGASWRRSIMQPPSGGAEGFSLTGPESTLIIGRAEDHNSSLIGISQF